LQKLSNNKVEIFYSNHLKKVLLEIFFVLLVNYLLYKIYLETGHLIENFVNEWYFTTNMMKLGDRLKCW